MTKEGKNGDIEVESKWDVRIGRKLVAAVAVIPSQISARVRWLEMRLG